MADWLRDLIGACELDPAGGGARLRQVVGQRRARIGLDDDVVEVWLRGAKFEVGPVQHAVPVDGTGSTSSRVVVDLLEGRTEVAAAFHDGSIEATGHRQSVTRIFHAVEILLDASSRVPEMRRLADEFRSQHGSSAVSAASHGAPDDGLDREHRLLERLGLLGEPR